MRTAPRKHVARLSAASLAAALACVPSLVAVPRAAELLTHDEHVRTTDKALRAAFDDGLAHSETFRNLVNRLQASDVVVFLVYDRKPSGEMASHISFVSAAGGRRYLTIGMLVRLPRVRQVAILAHELQHAVEIADAPGVVDAASMAVYYGGLKYAGIVDASRQHRFESRAAVDIEVRVTREMRPVVRAKTPPGAKAFTTNN
jgi:hypothetical protein